MRSLLAGLVVLLLAVPAVAAEGTPVRIRGKVEALDGQTLVVTSREGERLSVTLADDYQVSAVAKVEFSAIKPGDYVGVAALPGTDGRLHAQEVLVFPEAARGVGEGHRDWDLSPGSTMTNATVAEVSQAESGVLKVRYKDGEQTIEVAADTPIVTLALGDPSLLTAGAVVFIPATKLADGSLVAERVVAGKDGVNPPM